MHFSAMARCRLSIANVHENLTLDISPNTVVRLDVNKNFISVDENITVAEMEVTPSTSGDVGERFNGYGVVLTIGKPTVTEVIRLPLKAASDSDSADIRYGLVSGQRFASSHRLILALG
jgi:hypothetical protein